MNNPNQIVRRVTYEGVDYDEYPCETCGVVVGAERVSDRRWFTGWCDCLGDNDYESWIMDER